MYNVLLFCSAMLVLSSCASSRVAPNKDEPNPAPGTVVITDKNLTKAAIEYLATSKESEPEQYEKRKRLFQKALTAHFSTKGVPDSAVFQVGRNGIKFMFPVTFLRQKGNTEDAPGEFGYDHELRYPDHSATLTFLLEPREWQQNSAHAGIPVIAYRTLAENLFHVNPGGESIPVLAKQGAVDSAGLTWEITLREGVRFSDDTALTAYEVKRSLTSNLLNCKNGNCISTWLWMEIVGAKDFFAERSDSISGIIALDSLKLRIVLTQPRPNFMEHLSQPCFGITKQGPSGKVIGTGAFAMMEMTNESIICDRNPHYRGSEPLIREIKFVRNRQSLVDVLTNKSHAASIITSKKDVVYFRKIDSVATEPLSVEPLTFVALNPNSPPLTNLALRQFIATEVIRRWEIEKIITEAEVEATPSLFAGEEISIPAVEQHSVPNVSSPLKVIYAGANEVSRQIAERLCARMAQVGIACRPPRAVSAAELESLRQRGEYEILVDSFLPSFNAPLYNIKQLVETGYVVENSFHEKLDYSMFKPDTDVAEILENELLEKAIFVPLVRVKNYGVLPAGLNDVGLISPQELDFSNAWISQKNRYAEKN